MGYVITAILVIVLFVSLINKDPSRAFIGMNLWDILLNKTGFSNKINDMDQRMDTFLKQLDDKKEELAYLDQQITDLTQGLKEMPDKTQNKYFRDLLRKIQDKESILSTQIAQQEQVYKEIFLNSSPQEAVQDKKQRMDDMLQARQMRAQDQLQRMNALMEANQMRMEAIMERTNDLAEQNQMRLESYNQGH